MLSIYNYNSAPVFLKDALKEKKAQNSAFSLRAWARTLGMKSNAPLSLMLTGKRPIPVKYAHVFAKSLSLKEKESSYLEVLIQLHNAKSNEVKAHLLEKLKKINKQTDININEVDSFKALSDPLYATLIEATELKNFKADNKWIQSVLVEKRTLQEIEEAFQRLIELGLIKKDSAQYKKTHRSISTKPDVSLESAKKYHKAVAKLAIEAVDQQDVLSREFSGHALNIRKQDLPKAKLLLRELIKTFIFEIEAEPYKGEETYQLNLQFFKLLNSDGGKK